MFNADINSAGDGHIVVTLSGDGVHDLTEPEIERRLSKEEPDEHQKAWLKKTKSIVDEFTVKAFKIAFDAGVASVGTWQPWETAPIDGTYFDAWVEPNKKGREGFRAPHVHFDLDAFWTTETEYLYELGTPTHWRPEPEGPKK